MAIQSVINMSEHQEHISSTAWSKVAPCSGHVKSCACQPASILSSLPYTTKILLPEMSDLDGPDDCSHKCAAILCCCQPYFAAWRIVKNCPQYCCLQLHVELRQQFVPVLHIAGRSVPDPDPGSAPDPGSPDLAPDPGSASHRTGIRTASHHLPSCLAHFAANLQQR